MSFGLAVLIALILLAVNAFFVGAEFAVTSARRAQIEPLAQQEKRGAQTALFALENVSLMLATCQVGVTLCSTGLGMVAEPAVARIVEKPLVALGLPVASSHVVGFTVALLIVVYLHVVIGEMVPKNLAIATPDTAILFLGPPLVAIARGLRPIVRGLDGFANWILKLLGIEPKQEVAASFTVEEVASIVEASQAEGIIEDTGGLLSGTFAFSEESVADVMVLRDELVCVEPGVTPAELEREVARTGFSRFPYKDDEGFLAGYLHIKDVLYAQGDERNQAVEPWRIRRIVDIDCNEEVEAALTLMQQTGAHLARVTYGEEECGVIFLEDVLEELVGEVQDSMQRQIKS